MICWTPSVWPMEPGEQNPSIWETLNCPYLPPPQKSTWLINYCKRAMILNLFCLKESPWPEWFCEIIRLSFHFAKGRGVRTEGLVKSCLILSLTFRIMKKWTYLFPLADGHVSTSAWQECMHQSSIDRSQQKAGFYKIEFNVVRCTQCSIQLVKHARLSIIAST